MAGSRTWRTHWGLWPIGGIMLLAYGSMAVLDERHGTLRAAVTPYTIGWYLVAFVGFVAALWWNERHPIDTRWLWLAAIAFRLCLLATEPTLSDDVYRYIWDGHLVTEGVNPYTHPIDATELDRYDIPARALTNNPGLSSPYLPTAQVVFGAAAALLPSVPLSMQVIMTGFDLGAAALIARLLPLTRLPDHRLVLYLWNPLVIVEIAHGAHLDALMVFLAVLALWSGLSDGHRRRNLSGPALALAALTRPVPLLLAPVLWARWRGRDRVLFVASLVAPVALFGLGSSRLGLLGEADGRGVFGSARVYAQEFRFNAVVPTWIESAVGDIVAATGIGASAPTVTSVVIGAIMVVVLVMTWHAAQREPTGDHPAWIETRRSLRLAAVPLMAYVVLTPVMHPWYLVLLLALLPFVAPATDEPAWRWALLAPWLYLAATLSLSYLTYIDPDAFAELAPVRWIEWYPTLLALAALGAGAWWRHRGDSSPSGAAW